MNACTSSRSVGQQSFPVCERCSVNKSIVRVTPPWPAEPPWQLGSSLEVELRRRELSIGGGIAADCLCSPARVGARVAYPELMNAVGVSLDSHAAKVRPAAAIVSVVAVNGADAPSAHCRYFNVLFRHDMYLAVGGALARLYAALAKHLLGNVEIAFSEDCARGVWRFLVSLSQR